jgi:predicted N-acetyltransferase YhbS
MSVVVRPATEADADAICAFLHQQMNRRIAPERWRRLMRYPWLAEKPDLGRVAVDGARVAGYVGMVHADRAIGGRRERIVNICAWYLDRDYRGRGLGFELMRAATEDEGRSYTILTSSAKTLRLLDAVGYRVLVADRLRTIGGAPVILERIVLPARLFPGLALPLGETQEEELYELYEERFGVTVARAEERLKAVAADAADAAGLGVAEGAPLLEIDRLARDLEGCAVEWRRSRCDTAKHHYLSEIE